MQRRNQITERLLLLAICTSIGISPALADDSLENKIRAVVTQHAGTVCVAVKHLTTGENCAIDGDRTMPTASLIKLPVMIAAYDAVAADRTQLDLPIVLKESDKVPGSGILTEYFSPGTKISLFDAIRLMIAWSDNTATNLVIDQVGLAETNQLMEKLGCPNTRIHSKVYRRDTSISPQGSESFGLGCTTANDMVRLLEGIQRQRIVNADACAAMLDHLRACRDRTKIASGLPAGIEFAHKTGEISESRTDAGLILSPTGPIAICVLTSNNRDTRFADDNAAHQLCARIGAMVFQHYNPTFESTAVASFSILKSGSIGEMVEALQRTLNARLSPSPQLGVDGEFGPRTQQALMRFQREHSLAVTGETNAETWQALGPLLTSDDPIPDITAYNAAPVEKQPADPINGPPWVSAKAWAVADAATGKVFWGMNESEPRNPASTTKIMTGYLVARLVDREPAILDEGLTFSATADQTPGSTAGVRAGEQLPVGEALFGLLLPSGNDASVAMAEHFGRRLTLSPDPNADSTSAYDQFIAVMNATAQQLGLNETSYRNPHGLTAEGHMTSARDLARLAATAMQSAAFRKIVATRQHASLIQGPGGYQRTIAWTNTNRLLQIEGYDGIKTGTTDAAGSCLVSRGTRDAQDLIVVVLGASSSDSCYADTRNLYRWAWNQLAETKKAGD